MVAYEDTRERKERGDHLGGVLFNLLALSFRLASFWRAGRFCFFCMPFFHDSVAYIDWLYFALLAEGYQLHSLINFGHISCLLRCSSADTTRLRAMINVSASAFVFLEKGTRLWGGEGRGCWDRMLASGCGFCFALITLGRYGNIISSLTRLLEWVGLLWSLM